MKQIKSLLFVSLLSLFCFSQISLGVEVYIPKGNHQDVNYTGSTLINVSENGIWDTISLVNDYLRFFIALLCFLFFIWWGYQLISSQGKAEDLKKAKSMMIGAGIGIFVCILSYGIVKLVVNLLV